LLRSLGVDAQWRVLPPDDGFFQVTKRLHNWMQGKSGHLSKSDRETYIAYSERVAKQLGKEDADVWVVHDPQPLALRTMAPLSGPAIWRCTLIAQPPMGRLRVLDSWMRHYDRVLFTLPLFCLDGLARSRWAWNTPRLITCHQESTPRQDPRF